MRPKSFALLALALGCGLVASIGITQVMATRSTDTQYITGETETIFVAQKEVQMGDILSPQTVRLEQWPKDKIPAGAITDLKEVDGRRTKTKLFAGEPILEDKIFRKGEDYVPTIFIPKGFRVVSVKADMVATGGNLLNPGDRVDVMVYLTRSPQNEIHSTGTRTVLENVKVFAVNDIVGVGGEKDSKTIKAVTVSLLVAPDQAHKLTLASELGSIRLALRSPEDDSQYGTVEVTPGELLGPAQAGDAAKESLLAAEQGASKSGSSLTDLIKMAANRIPEPGNDEPKPLEPPAATPAPLPHPTWNLRILKPGSVEDVTLEMALEDDAESAGGLKRWRTGGGPTTMSPDNGGPLHSVIEQLKGGPKDEPAPPEPDAQDAPADSD